MVPSGHGLHHGGGSEQHRRDQRRTESDQHGDHPCTGTLTPCRRTSTSSDGSSTRASRSPTAPAPARAASSATRCASTSPPGSPCVTTKKVHTRSVFGELLWFLRGDTNVKWLQDRGITIWDEWADANGDLGPIYGYQWRSWPTPDGRHVDQLAQVVEQIRTNPDSPPAHRLRVERRRHPRRWRCAPCHTMFQFYVAAEGGSSAASSTSARPTCSSACRSTSRRTPC